MFLGNSRMCCNNTFRKAPTQEMGWGFVLLLFVTNKKPHLRFLVRFLDYAET